MRIIGIDLAVRAKHQAVIGDQQGQYISPAIKFETRLADLDQLRARALEGTDSACPLIVVMEATGIVWFPVSIYFLRCGATVHVVNPRMSADLARFYKRHARSDRLAARVLVRMPLVCPESLYPLQLAGGNHRALQRGCKELNRLRSQVSAIKNRLQAIDRLGWPGLPKRVFSAPTGTAARWFRNHFYDPYQVVEIGAEGLQQAWRAAEVNSSDDAEWIKPLVELAREVVQILGEQGGYLDYQALSAEVGREQQRLARLEADAKYVQLEVIRPVYRRLHPSRNLETLKGVGQDSAAVYLSHIGISERFTNSRGFRGWSGMVPRSTQSGAAESKGLRISKAGPNLIKKHAYLNADTARRWDPQLAALYYDQMVNKGKHHSQAVCACATHLLDRIRVVLTEDRPYELRDVDGTPVTTQQARIIAQERYTLPEDVRRRNTKRARRERAERTAQKRSRSR
jgi:transposase